ncbi:MAG TPA: lysozyme inhibitor LprI family protein [Pyrinomonadaceae bacterium]|nr:lysozyme inhibitor LprI family protein [Pyrinomonadaceae bacterium]
MTKLFAAVMLALTSFSYPLATPTSRGSVPGHPAAIASPSLTQEQSKHPIDKALDACTDKNGSTAGMVQCTDQAYAAWDKELNKNYGLLMQNLKAQQKDALKAAQLEWIKQRDLEFKFIDSVYDALEGTMYISMRIAARMEVVKHRALELHEYLDLVKEFS